jgi:hypothetical protein
MSLLGDIHQGQMTHLSSFRTRSLPYLRKDDDSRYVYERIQNQNGGPHERLAVFRLDSPRLV